MRQLKVFKDRIRYNLSLLEKKKPLDQILLMIKANAYGHGMNEIYAVTSEMGVSSFGVASILEARELRDCFTDSSFLKNEIYVFSELELNGRWEDYKDYKILPVISHIEDLKFILNRADLNYLPICLKFNTGMNRLGLSLNEGKEVIHLLKKFNRDVYHLMTHFSDSYIPKKKKTEEQYKKFKDLKNEFDKNSVVIKKTSVANSGAIENDIGIEETMIRPGLMFYGPQSSVQVDDESRAWEGKVISNLETTILKSQFLSSGEKLEFGYGSSVVKGAGTLILVSIGYGDGLLNLTKGIEIDAKGHKLKVVGRINMDMIYLWIYDEIDHTQTFSPGEKIVFWDENAVNFQRLSEHCGLIPYEMFCNITNRVQRVLE